MKTYFYHILSNEDGVMLVAVVRDSYWNIHRHLSDGIRDAKLMQIITSLGGDEAAESLYELPSEVTENRLVTEMSKVGIVFSKNEALSAYLSNH